MCRELELAKESFNLEPIQQQIARTMQNNMDLIIKRAVSNELGNDWVVDDLAGRVERLILPDGAEVYTLDGKPVLEVIHTQFEMGVTELSGFIEYKILND